MVLDVIIEYFSIAAFILTLRETMEAALIVSILLAYLTKTQNHEFKKDVYLGTGLAVALSFVFALLIQVTAGTFGEVRIFGIPFEPLFEGTVMIAAALVLTTMIIWMFRHARTIKKELETKVQEALIGTNRYALLSIAFIAVMREGIETVLFLTGVSVAESDAAVVGGGIFGIIIAIALAAGLYRGSLELDLRKFFNITSVLLILFAAGLLSYGVYEFQEIGFFGPKDAFWNVPLWDTSWLLKDNDGGFGTLMRALFGYQDRPSMLELLAYFGYWIGAALAFYKINKMPINRVGTTA